MRMVWRYHKKVPGRRKKVMYGWWGGVWADVDLMWIWCVYIYTYIHVYIYDILYVSIYTYTHCFGSFFRVWIKNKQILMSKGRTTHLSESVRLLGWFFRRVCLTSWQITILNRRYADSNRCSSIRMLRFWSQQRRWMVQRISFWSRCFWKFQAWIYRCVFCFVYFWLLVGMIMILAGEFFQFLSPFGFIKSPRRSPHDLLFLDRWTSFGGPPNFGETCDLP